MKKIAFDQLSIHLTKKHVATEKNHPVGIYGEVFLILIRA